MKDMNQISKVATLSVIALLMANCSASKMSSAASQSHAAGIVNGQEVTEQQVGPGGAANSVVGLLIKKTMTDPSTQKPVQGAAVCTGTLIAADMVLTAGHCMLGSQASDVIVFVQSTNFGSNKTVTAKSVLVNAAYVKDQRDSKNDVAILRLTSALPASTAAAAALTSKDFDMLSAYKITLGYGQSDERNNTPEDRNGTGVLRVTTVMDGVGVIPASLSGQAMPANMVGMILADSTVTSVCHGDSGGPLFAADSATKRLLLVGVNDEVNPVYQGQQGVDFMTLMKANPQTALDELFKKYPDAHICSGRELFVNVANQLDWIQQTMTTLRSQP